MSLEKLGKIVREKAEAQKETVFTVIPELKFRQVDLDDPEPLTFTFKELFDLFVDSGQVYQEDEEQEQEQEQEYIRG